MDNNQKFQIAVTNLMSLPEEQPEGAKKFFGRLSNLRESVGGIEQAINEARQSLQQLTENRSRMLGSVDTLVDLIKDDMPKELIEKHGQKLNQPQGPQQNGLPEAEKTE